MKQYSIVRNGRLINVCNEKELKRILKNNSGNIEVHEIMNIKDCGRTGKRNRKAF